jgi:hypothetical protein
MKWNRIVGKVLKRDSGKPAPALQATTADRPAPKRKKTDPAERPSTEDQWLRVLEESEPEHNPYDTYSWELDPGTEERKLKRKQFGPMDTHAPQDATGGMNPYDTGVFRGSGWDG